jgi:Cu-Zn family superoxide dismutase
MANRFAMAAALLRTADGTPVANATLDFANGFARVTVETTQSGILSPGFHGMHIHSVGKCEADSEPPGGGHRGDFLSAGGHFQAPGHTGHPASGDLTALEVRSDGSAGPDEDTLATGDAGGRVACGVIQSVSATTTSSTASSTTTTTPTTVTETTIISPTVVVPPPAPTSTSGPTATSTVTTTPPPTTETTTETTAQTTQTPAPGAG